MSEPTKLYRYYDTAGSLLYVGISRRAIQRLAEHEADKSWQSDIASVRIETFPDRASAHSAERAAINNEKPTRNLIRYATQKVRERSFQATRPAKPSSAEINESCLAVLTSIYEEMHWTDFIGKYGFGGGHVVALNFRRTDRIESLLEDWMRDGRYDFDGRFVGMTVGYGKYDEAVEIDIVRRQFGDAEIEEFALSKHAQLHDEILAGAPLDEARRANNPLWN